MAFDGMKQLEKIVAISGGDEESELQHDFGRASPFRHLVIDDFFEGAFAHKLHDSFPPFDDTLALNEDGKIGQKCVHENLAGLGGAWRQLDQLIQTREFLDWLGEITGIEEVLLYDPHYFGGGTHENRHGQDLDPHVDFNRHPITGWHRRLNLIVYLNETWHEDWGGAIEFHSDPRLPREENHVKQIQPRFNRAVLFETTHWSWHGFERIELPEGDADSRSRKSVALYFYSRSRPEDERTRPHSTIYVDRPLPAHIQAGMTLSAADFESIQVLLTRRDHHLQRLYRHISGLQQQLEDQQGEVSPPRFVDCLRLPYLWLRHRAGRVLRKLGLRS